MDTTVIIILAIILLALIILNNIKVVKIDDTSSNTTAITRKANCSQTIFGCCPNGVDSKIDTHGTNCPGFNPGPGYLKSPNPIVNVEPLPPNPVPGLSIARKKPIGGCAGTRYGCCLDNNTPKIDETGSNCLVH